MSEKCSLATGWFLYCYGYGNLLPPITCRDDDGEIMRDLDASGMQRRSPGKKKIQRRNYIGCGPNDTWHIDGIFLTEVINNMLNFIIVIASTYIVP